MLRSEAPHQANAPRPEPQGAPVVHEHLAYDFDLAVDRRSLLSLNYHKLVRAASWKEDNVGDSESATNSRSPDEDSVPNSEHALAVADDVVLDERFALHCTSCSPAAAGWATASSSTAGAFRRMLA